VPRVAELNSAPAHSISSRAHAAPTHTHHLPAHTPVELLLLGAAHPASFTRAWDGRATDGIPFAAAAAAATHGCAARSCPTMAQHPAPPSL